MDRLSLAIVRPRVPIASGSIKNFGQEIRSLAQGMPWVLGSGQPVA